MHHHVIPSSLARPWRKCLGTNYAGSFVAVNPDYVPAQTGGRPAVVAGQALIDFSQSVVPSRLHIVLFGAGSDDQTVKCRVWGFRSAVGGFIGTLLWAGTGTLSQTAGTAGFDILDTDLYCDLITTTVGTESIDCRTLSPGGEIPAKVMIVNPGCEFVIVEFDKDAATSANALLTGE